LHNRVDILLDYCFRAALGESSGVEAVMTSLKRLRVRTDEERIVAFIQVHFPLSPTHFSALASDDANGLIWISIYWQSARDIFIKYELLQRTSLEWGNVPFDHLQGIVDEGNEAVKAIAEVGISLPSITPYCC
jgi:hypothetical protein